MAKINVKESNPERYARAAAEQEMIRLEQELKTKLLQVHG